MATGVRVITFEEDAMESDNKFDWDVLRRLGAEYKGSKNFDWFEMTDAELKRFKKIEICALCFSHVIHSGGSSSFVSCDMITAVARLP